MMSPNTSSLRLISISLQYVDLTIVLLNEMVGALIYILSMISQKSRLFTESE